MRLKGNAVCEKGIFVRLHLLQGILLYHENKRKEAYKKLIKANVQLMSLKVNERELKTLLEMGYHTTESRVALRACENDVPKAIQFITEKRAQRKEAKRKWRQENEAIRKAGGQYNIDQKWVNPRNINTLVEMGFAENLSAVALRKTDNNVAAAVSSLV